MSTAIRKNRIPSDNCDEQGVLLYNLDAIIAVGYRVNSYEATQFRIWAREILKCVMYQVPDRCKREEGIG